VLEVINYFFAALFGLEAAIKIIALDKQYFKKNGWNLFDFLVVLGSSLSIILSFVTTINIKGAITIIRSFRILRVLRLV
jgi:hypothetical protein